MEEVSEELLTTIYYVVCFFFFVSDLSNFVVVANNAMVFHSRRLHLGSYPTGNNTNRIPLTVLYYLFTSF